MILDVRVNGALAGHLSRGADEACAFSYLPDTPEDALVSLTMPVVGKSYHWKSLHPVFQMNLPEGFQKDVARATLGPVAVTDDFNLLAAVGGRSIGRVTLLPHGIAPDGATPDADLAAILSGKDCQQRFLDRLRGLHVDAVSGVMPKHLERTHHDKATQVGQEWVIKTGPHDIPFLALNEWLTMRAAEASGLNIPEMRISDDRSVLAVRRFDVIDQGFLGAEDFCSLKGLPPHRKYEGTCEQLAKYLNEYVSPRNIIAARKRLFHLVAFNIAAHNADAHLKNYSLIYSGVRDVALAPPYDLITVTAYPALKLDLPALPLNGKRTWFPGKDLVAYGMERLGLTRTECMAAMAAVRSSLEKTIPAVVQCTAEIAEFHEVGKRMVVAWLDGMAAMALQTRIPDDEMRSNLNACGLSDQRRIGKQNPYRSREGAFSSKVR
jgi:serine/threonine-protein kinase HipA